MTVAPPQYLQIAVDLARRIADHELREGTRLHGRSLMASRYNVSPETIRRAVCLLADMQVVEVRPQSGVVVLSAERAEEYIRNFQSSADTRSLMQRLRTLMGEYDRLHQQILETATALLKRPGLPVKDPLPNYEVMIPEGSPLLGRGLGELKFWQATGCTVVAIRRGGKMILSPGPYAQLQCGDGLILVGAPDAVSAAKRLAAPH